MAQKQKDITKKIFLFEQKIRKRLNKKSNNIKKDQKRSIRNLVGQAFERTGFHYLIIFIQKKKVCCLVRLYKIVATCFSLIGVMKKNSESFGEKL